MILPSPTVCCGVRAEDTCLLLRWRATGKGRWECSRNQVPGTKGCLEALNKLIETLDTATTTVEQLTKADSEMIQ